MQWIVTKNVQRLDLTLLNTINDLKQIPANSG